jgi:signal transduction histidine kinase
MTGVIIIKGILEVPEGFSGNALLLALLSAAAFGGRWRTWACGISFVAIMGYMTYRVVIVDLSDFEGNQVLFRIFAMFWNYVIFGAAWWFGDILRGRRHRTIELEERTIQLEHEREENARRAVLDERVRIARELHDVVAHHVSVMGVQAGAARQILDQKQGKVYEALSIIETSSRQAVAELHRLLGFLRQGSQTGELSPQPSMKQLNTLVTQMEDAGLSTKVEIEGDERPLPPSVDLSAYRIIQEALTNTLKHAGPATATVTIRYSDEDIELEILDDGHESTAYSGDITSGKGLIGMRERVNLHGGELEAQKIPGGGFLVRAKLLLNRGIS